VENRPPRKPCRRPATPRRDSRVAVHGAHSNDWNNEVAYEISHLRALEAEAIHIIREVAAEFERPVMLFSGGKDSIVMLRLAEKAFWPARIPFPVMHIDTGHNFDEVIAYRDHRVAELGVRLVVASVQDDIDAGRVSEETGPNASRNRLQTTTLLRGIEEGRHDAADGATRKRRERRSACSASATRSASGSRNCSGRRSGRSTTAATARASTFACFRSATGPNSTSGST
jgi:3'-phosphoadenosine 5'-phosphosulfate sulfotransferase (PAPS reductase)/FAD synthetase